MEKRALLLAFGLVFVGIMSRLLPHAPNVTPLIAVALFSGAYLPRRLAIAVPVIVMIVSDLLIGYDPQVLFNWVAVGLAACVGLCLRERRSATRIVAASLSASTLFFLVSNFGVWIEVRLYPVTLEGLRTCYVAGIPFYRHMLAGDVMYTAICFGIFAWVSQWQRRPALTFSR